MFKKKSLLIILLVIGLMVAPLQGVFASEYGEFDEDDLPIIDMVSGFGRTFYLVQDGRIFGSGRNANGSLGVGSSISSTTEIIEVPVTDIKQVTTSRNATYFIKNNGDLYVTGVSTLSPNSYGGPGIDYYPVKVTVPGASNISKVTISLDGKSFMLLTADGEVFVTGDNSKGQIGAGGYSTVTGLRKLNNISNAIDVQMGDDYSTILLEDGTVLNSGYDKGGMLGFNSNHDNYYYTHTEISHSGGINVVQVAAGTTHIVYISDDNGLYVTGDTGAVIGNENSGNNVKKITLVQKFHSKIGSIDISEAGVNRGYDVSDSLSFVLLENGELWVVGRDPYGASLDGDSGDTITAYKKVAEDVMKFFVGGNHTLIGKKDAKIIAGGNNQYGEIQGQPVGVVNTPVQLEGMYYAYGNFNINQPEDDTTDPSVGKVVILREHLTMLGSSRILGDALTNNGDVTMEWNTFIQGDLHMKSTNTFTKRQPSNLRGSKVDLTSDYVFKTWDYDLEKQKLDYKGSITTDWAFENSGEKITDSGYYTDINIVQNRELRVDTSAGDIYLFVDILDIDQGNLVVEGNNRVIIYAERVRDFSGSSNTGSGADSNQLLLFITDKETDLNFSGATQSNIGVYAPNTHIDILAGAGLRGTLVGKSLDMAGNVELYGKVVDFTNVVTDGTTTPDTPTNPDGDELTEEMLEELAKLDFDVVFNVASTGNKETGKYLKAYQKTLETMNTPHKNKSLDRINKILDILGEDYTPFLKYGTYNLYNDYRFIGN